MNAAIAKHLVKMQTRGFSKEFRKCGNPRCRCHRGEPHGPYWVRFLLYRGKTRRKLTLGAVLPGETKMQASKRFADVIARARLVFKTG